jgi:hypothetical protein
VPAAGPWLATNLAEAGGEGDGLLGGGELCGVGVPRRHGADCEETRRRAAGAGGGDGGGDAAAVARDGWRRIGEASTGRGESSGGGDEERVREEEAHARSHVGALPCRLRRKRLETTREPNPKPVRPNPISPARASDQTGHKVAVGLPVVVSLHYYVHWRNVILEKLLSPPSTIVVIRLFY